MSRMKIQNRRLLRKGGRWTWAIRLCIISLIGVGHLSCQKTQSRGPQRYELHGKVVSVDKAQRQITVAHEEVKGYMPAMTMPFALKDEWAFDVLGPGDEIGASLIVDGSTTRLEEIVISKRGEDQPATADKQQAENGPQPGDEV